MSDRFDQYYMLQTQAKKMEQAGNTHKAIELYTQIVTGFQPYDDFAFDRLSVLLEKSYKVAESTAICEKAIEKIKNGDIKGDIHKFEERIKRLSNKAQAVVPSEKTIKEKEVVNFHVPLLKHFKGIYALMSYALYGLALAVSLPDHWLRFVVIFLFFGFIDYLISGLFKLVQNKRAFITMTISLLFLASAIFSSLQLPEVKELIMLKENVTDAESETLVKESAGIIIEDPDAPLIDEELLEKARKTIELEPSYENCRLSATSNTVEMALTVKAGTSQEEAERLFKKFGRNLSALAAEKGTTPPSDGNYGSLYEIYTLNFTATDTFDAVVLTGTLHDNKVTIQ